MGPRSCVAVLALVLSWLPSSAPFSIAQPLLVPGCAASYALEPVRPSPNSFFRQARRLGGLVTLAAQADSQTSESSGKIFTETGQIAAGSVLVSSPDESDHFFRQAVVLVIDHGDFGTKGLLLEMATAFSIGEMATAVQNTALGENKLFRGGADGEDKVVMLHTFAGVQGALQVGNSGIFIGGMQSAQELVAKGLLPASGFKFIYNQCEWGPGKLDREVRQGSFRVGRMSPELATRQVASQSERIRIFDRAGRVDPDDPLWDVLRREMGLKGPKAVKSEAPKDEKLDAKKMMILGMVVERIFELRNKRDAVGLLPLLDLDAIVFGQQGNEEIQEAFEASWFDSTSRLELDVETVDIKDTGVVTYSYTEYSETKPGGTVRHGELKFSPYGMIRELDEDVWWKSVD